MDLVTSAQKQFDVALNFAQGLVLIGAMCPRFDAFLDHLVFESDHILPVFVDSTFQAHKPHQTRNG